VRYRAHYAVYRLLAFHAVGHLGVWQTTVAWSNAIQKVER
jgi:hypothetical protein